MTGVIATSCTLDSRMMSWRDQTSTPSVIANAATSAATPMITPVVDKTVRIGLVLSASAPTLADSMRAVRLRDLNFSKLRTLMRSLRLRNVMCFGA